MDTNIIIATVVDAISKAVMDSQKIQDEIASAVEVKTSADKLQPIVATACREYMDENPVSADEVDELGQWIDQALQERVIEADEVSGLDEYIANQIDTEIESQLNDKFADMTIPKDNVEELSEELDAMDDKIDDAIARLKVLEFGGQKPAQAGDEQQREIDRLTIKCTQLELQLAKVQAAVHSLASQLVVRCEAIGDVVGNAANEIGGIKSDLE